MYSLSVIQHPDGKLSAKLSTDNGLVELDQLSKKQRVKVAEKLYSYNGLKLYENLVLLTVNRSGKLALCNPEINKKYKETDFLNLISSYISTDEATQVSQQVQKDLRERTFDRKLTMGIVLRSSGQQEIQLILLTINKDHGLVSYTVQMHSSLWDQIMQDAHKQLSSAASATSETGAKRSSSSDSEDSGSDYNRRGTKRKAEQETESVGNKRTKTDDGYSMPDFPSNSGIGLAAPNFSSGSSSSATTTTTALSNKKRTVIFSKNSVEEQHQGLAFTENVYTGSLSKCFTQNNQGVKYELHIDNEEITGKIYIGDEILDLRSLRRVKDNGKSPLFAQKGLKTALHEIVISTSENRGRIVFVSRGNKCKDEVDLLNAIQHYQLVGDQSENVLSELNGIEFSRGTTTAIILTSSDQKEKSLLIFSYSSNDHKMACYVITMSSSDWNYTLRDARKSLNQ